MCISSFFFSIFCPRHSVTELAIPRIEGVSKGRRQLVVLNVAAGADDAAHRTPHAPHLVPDVRLLVCLQGGPLREAPSAVLADVGLLPRVHSDVLHQLVLLREALWAHRAGVRFVPSVSPQVELQLLPAGKPLAADVAED